MENFIGENHDDHLMLGCIMALLEFEFRRPEYYMDPKLERKAYGCSVVLIRHIGDRLFNIVVVSKLVTVVPSRAYSLDLV
jgi:hypothetical protein